MARLRIATWNVNSVRSHMDVVERFVAAEAPDLLCLQETKVADEQFPLADLRKMGFAHHAIFGQKAYHGVAVFSREAAIEKVEKRRWCEIEDARHLQCRVAGIELHNFYVPAGGDVPDVEANDKFAHKLRFMTEVTDWFRRRKRKTNRFVLVGDLNVAPLESDVWNHKQLQKVVSHTPIEIEHMDRWQASHDWVDAVREIVPPEEPLYSWWSYRARDWRAANRGRRLDHVWVTPALADGVRDARVVDDARGWPKTSDHAPVVVDLDV